MFAFGRERSVLCVFGEMSHKMRRVFGYSVVILAVLAMLGTGSGLAARRTVLLEQVTNAGCG
jgi:hypothetical protein